MLTFKLVQTIRWEAYLLCQPFDFPQTLKNRDHINSMALAAWNSGSEIQYSSFIPYLPTDVT